ncbi:PAS domain S-box-containing protein [Roseateles sp. YR242]|uniref:DUF6058 family natural product biosynthesis protein n=1 Tax=Roseateles sp. YR242 TaxID=1855305 RepID=UPI0008C4B276|nr:GAF domain-containing protein [Roseateles sp. YR242]SEK83925.1 PAS domain S-box-containing protein [Roseateles sp. YR242]
MPSAFSGLSMRARLLVTLGLSLVMVAASALLGLWQTQRLADTAESLYADRLIPLSLLRDMARDLGPQGLGQLLSPATSTGAPLTERDTQRLGSHLRRQWQDYLSTRFVATETAMAERVQLQLETLLKGVDTVDQASAEQLRALNQQRLALMKLIDDLATLQLSQARLDTERSHEATGDAARLGVLLVMVTAGLCGAMIWTIWYRYDEERRASHDARERLQRMYQALSQTNQLIVRREADLDLGPSAEQVLFDGLCRICVETGHARVATVVLVEGASFVRTAAFGNVARWMPGMPPRWSLDTTFSQSSMSTRAILAGTHQVSNRALQDPTISKPGSPVIPPGIEAMAAFPLRRGGEVVGALSLLAGEPDFFDDTVIGLFNEMAGDLSFALDNLSRERERAQALSTAREASDELRCLIQAMPVHMVLTRLPDGLVLEINDAMCQRYGITRDEVIGRRLMDLGVGMLPPYRGRYYELLRDHKDVVGLPARAATRDGRVLASRVHARRLRYHGQDCVIGCSVDLDDPKDTGPALDAVINGAARHERGDERGNERGDERGNERANERGGGRRAQSPGESPHADSQS